MLAFAFLALLQVPGDEAMPPVPVALAPALEVVGGVEVAAVSLDGGVWLHMLPVVSVNVSHDFMLELGAPIRVFPPDGLLLPRIPDWDERSEWIQLLRRLRIGGPERMVQVEAGALEGVTLGRGHLLTGYFNRIAEDYHPTGARLMVTSGRFGGEAVVSDLLAPRIFGLATRMSFGEPFHFEFSALHDFGLGGGDAPSLTLAHLDADAVLVRTPMVRLIAYAGLGARLLVPDPAAGALLGLSLEGTAAGLVIGGRLEGRKTGGSFRHGMVSLAYEMSRFAGSSLSGEALADERLPDAWSLAAELQAESTLGLARLYGLASVEAFNFGRTDLRIHVSASLLAGFVTVNAVAEALKVDAVPRWYAAGECRVRLMPALYGMVQAGTSFRRAADGQGLERSFTALLGMGVDFSFTPAPGLASSAWRAGPAGPRPPAFRSAAATGRLPAPPPPAAWTAPAGPPG
jgi:hypothetical protein